MDHSAGAAVDAPRKTKSKALVIVLIALLLVCGAIVFVLHRMAVEQRDREEAERVAIISADTFRKGVSVAGVDISGMTLEQAREVLKPAEAALTKDVGFTVADATHTYEAPASCFTIAYDTEEKLREAMGLAREGTLEELRAELADIEAAGRSYDISYTITADYTAFVAGIAEALYVAPVDAAFSVKSLE